MDVTGRNTLKGWFKKWLKPKENQFAAWLDAFWHKTEDVIPIENIDGLSEILGNKIDRQEIENISSQLLLERRLTFKVETSSIDFFIDEPMKIYKVTAVNVSYLSITIDGVETELDPEHAIDFDIPAGSIAVFNVERQLTDSTSYLYVYAKVKTT